MWLQAETWLAAEPSGFTKKRQKLCAVDFFYVIYTTVTFYYLSFLTVDICYLCEDMYANYKKSSKYL
jgi:hypothetical protein